jgi:hypothetical protein
MQKASLLRYFDAPDHCGTQASNDCQACGSGEAHGGDQSHLRTNKWIYDNGDIADFLVAKVAWQEATAKISVYKRL